LSPYKTVILNESTAADESKDLHFLRRLTPQIWVPHPCDFFLSQGWDTTTLNKPCPHHYFC